MTASLSYQLVDEMSCDTVLELMRQLYKEDGYRFDPEAAQEALVGLVQNSSLGRAWLVFERDEMVGYVVLTFGYSLEYGGRDATLDELFVVPIHRGRGVGTRVMEFVAEECQSLGVVALRLEVEQDNETAQALYERAGFEAVDRYLMCKRIS